MDAGIEGCLTNPGHPGFAWVKHGDKMRLFYPPFDLVRAFPHLADSLIEAKGNMLAAECMAALGLVFVPAMNMYLMETLLTAAMVERLGFYDRKDAGEQGDYPFSCSTVYQFDKVRSALERVTGLPFSFIRRSEHLKLIKLCGTDLMDNTRDYAWVNSECSGGQVRLVALLKRTGIGVYDLVGNVATLLREDTEGATNPWVVFSLPEPCVKDRRNVLMYFPSWVSDAQSQLSWNPGVRFTVRSADLQWP
jgi:hypothetical protein